ncbi:MAG TPA: glycosyltransferase family 4 protein [Thermoanaerobaculia bacterium]|nr:glycosyltransferase family 4 protein [Thermoanaerobaculia bacterium]
MTYRLAVVASHVIQYQDPLFRLLAAEPDIDLTVLYCSRHGLEQFRDADMATTLAWDIDLLGYPHRFLWNASKDLNRGFWRLVNPGIVPALVRGQVTGNRGQVVDAARTSPVPRSLSPVPYDAVLFMTGWGAFTALLGILTCWLFRIPFFLYGDSSFPPAEDSARSRIRAGLMRMLFALTTGFMTSGVLNADYYRHYGADPRRFFLLPWAIDNDRFARDCGVPQPELRAQYGIAQDAVVFLFSAKLVERKDPFALLKAFERMRHRGRAAVVFMGDGVLREPLERYAREHNLGGAHFIGFVNQAAIPKHYAMADVFVLPSMYEPRGAVINEAMACGLPVVVTDRCGSIGDIVLDGDNAFIYPAGDAAALAEVMDRLVEDADLRKRMGERSREIISTWDYRRGVAGVKEMLRWVARQ